VPELTDTSLVNAKRRLEAKRGGGTAVIMNILPLMLVPLLVWIAVWGYLWSLDGKVKRLEREMSELEDMDSL